MSVFDGYSAPQESNTHLGPLSTDSPVPGAPGEPQHHQSPWASREEPPVSRAGSSTSPMENWNWSHSGLCSWRGPSGRDVSTSLTIKHGPRSDNKTVSGLLHQCLARCDAPTTPHGPTGGRVIALPWMQPELSQPPTPQAGLCCQASLPLLPLLNFSNGNVSQSLKAQHVAEQEPGKGP